MSMGFAIALIGLTSLAMALLLLPLLLRQRLAESSEAYNLAVYRDQLAEVERDLARGLLTDEQAEAARAEIGRRILAIAPAAATATSRRLSPALLAVSTVIILLVPFSAWTFYWQIGSPSVPDQPFASRGGDGTTSVAGGDPNPHPDMAGAVAKLGEHLKEHPDDLAGWQLLGRANVGLGRYEEAVEAYRHAADLSHQNPPIVGDYGEALVLAAGGVVTPPAEKAFEVGLKEPETAPRSRYYIALAAFQRGDTQKALQGWVDLEADSPADADWLPLLRRRIAEAAAKAGVDAATLKTSSGKPRPPVTAAAAPARPPSPAPTAGPAPGSGPTAAAPPPNHPPVPAGAPAQPPVAAAAPQPQAGGGPSGDTVAAVARATAGASADERQAMIRGMVANLATKMEKNPGDADGWIRLGRSYMVLNEPAQARDAYAKAVKLRPTDTALKEAYADAIVTAAGDSADGPPAEAIAVLREVLAAEPKNQEALWYVGFAEAQAGNRAAAVELWTRLLAQLPAGSAEHKELEGRLAALKAGK
jgi:cytochrome c-type biogenesis protein CcmH